MKNTSTIRFAWLPVVLTLLALSVPFRSVAQEHTFIDLKAGKKELLTSDNPLCFNVGELRIAITNAEGDCEWTLDSDGGDHLSKVSTSGANNDTIEYSYNPVKNKSKRLGITVTWLKNGSPVSYSLYYDAACKAEKPGVITVLTNHGTPRIGYERNTDEVNREVYCAGLRYQLSVQEGADREYSVLAPLHYGWFVASSEDGAGGTVVEGYREGPAKNRASFAVTNSLNGKFWQVRAKTCDDGHETTPSTKKIENIIRKNILEEPLTITHIRFGVKGEAGGVGMPGGAGGGATKPKPFWLPISETADADEMENIACVNYSKEFNSKGSNIYLGDPKRDDQTGSVNMEESENGYIDLEAGPFDIKDDILFPHYRFRWIFDTADFEFATKKMETDLYRHADSGFGVDRVRVCLRVKEHKLTEEEIASGKVRSNRLPVKVEVYCPDCEAEAASNGVTDTTYRKMSSELVFTRVDSLPEELPYTPVVRNIVGDEVSEVCGNTVNQFCTKLDEGYTYNGKLTFIWVTSWKEAGGVSSGCKGLVAPEIALTETHFGDTNRLYVYPRNQCFRNGSLDLHRDTVKVYVKALPPAPNIYDPLDKANPTFLGVKEDKEGPGMGGVNFMGRASVLLCNYNKSYDGVPNNEYYLISTHSPIKPKLSNGTPGNEGYVITLPDGYDDKDISFLIRSLDGGVEANDTNIVAIIVKESAHQKLKGQKQLSFGFAAANECGAGSTNYFPVNIIDTLNVFAHVKRAENDLGLDSAAWACEGEHWVWGLEGEADHFVTNPVVKNGPEDPGSGAERNTDLVDHIWTFSDPTWSFYKASAEYANPTEVNFGRESGQVMLALRNRCGTGKARRGDYVNVNPYTRVNIKVVDGLASGEMAYDPKDPNPVVQKKFEDNPYLLYPCRSSERMYACDTSKLTDLYRWEFPADWVVQINETDATYGNATAVPGHPNWAYTSREKLTYSFSDMRVRVLVGGDTGNIYVVGQTEACKFEFDNFAPDNSIDPPWPGHNRDSLRAAVRPFTGKPSLKDWPVDVCAREIYTLVAQPDPKQDAKTQSETHFTWKYPEDWVEVSANGRGDTVVVRIPDRISEEKKVNGDKFRSDTVRVYSHRYDCDPTNKGDSSFHAFRLVDTLPLPLGDDSWFVDLLQPKGEINTSPCEGDTVEYILVSDEFHAEIDSIVYRWDVAGTGIGTQDFVSGDSIDITGWRVLNAKYSTVEPRNPTNRNGIKMIVGRAPLRIMASSAAHCGESSPTKFLDIKPISLVRDTVHLVRGRDLLCMNEKMVFEWDSVKYATQYDWYYPWGKQHDTIRIDQKMFYREFGRRTEFDKGYIYVRPSNRCGVGPYSDSVKIGNVIKTASLGVPTVTADVPGYTVRVDTLYDTICLRTPRIYEASYSNPDYEEGLEWRYRWFNFATDVLDTLMIGNADSSRCSFISRAGFEEKYIGVAVHHKDCALWGDTLTLRIRPSDTVAIDDATLADRLSDGKREDGAIMTRPCGSGEAEWHFNSDFGAEKVQYRFVWWDSLSQDRARYHDADGSMVGEAAKKDDNFTWTNPKTEGDLNDAWYSGDEDVLEVKIPNNQLLYLSVDLKNRCGISRLPSLAIRTVVSIKDSTYNLERLSDLVCDGDSLVFRVDSSANIGGFIWYYPWGKTVDTVKVGTQVVRTFNTQEYQTGQVYVIPYNGCGNAQESNRIEIEEVLRIPSRAVPVDFDPGYDASQDPIARDTLCMRTRRVLHVNSESWADGGDYEMDWRMVQGDVLGFTRGYDSCVLTSTDVNAKPFVLEFFSRAKGCKRYSDTLQIRILSMDTLTFAMVEDEDAGLGRLEVLLPQIVRNYADETLIDRNPCSGTDQKYTIAGNIHWSVVSDALSYFSWNARGEAPQTDPGADGAMGSTDWKFVGQPVDGFYRDLPLVVGAEDELQLHVNLQNICGTSQSPALSVVPDRKVTQKPSIFISEGNTCLGTEMSLYARKLQGVVETLEWIHPWSPDPILGNKKDPYLRKVTVGPETGDIILWAGNHCEAHAMSDTLKVEAVMQTPQRPEPAWLPEGRPYTWKDADTVVEYVCLHGKSTLTVKPGEGDGSAMEFVWDFKDGSHCFTEKSVEESSYVLWADMATLTDSALLAVCGNYPACGKGYYGDTLYIRLRFTDTVESQSISMIDYSHKGTGNGGVLCPDAEVLLSVMNRDPMNPMVSYHWNLPGTGADAWRIKDAETGNPNLSPDLQFEVPGDSNSSSIVAIVGEAQGSVSVQLRTSTSVLGCPYLTRPVELEDKFMVRLRPDAPVFSGTFTQEPCVGQRVEYAITSVDGARAYRWQVPVGWRFNVSNGTVREDTIWEVEAKEAGATRCTVIAGQDTGYIRVWAVDSCNGGPALSLENARIVYPQDTARLTVLGDHAACIDSTIDLAVRGDGVYMLSDADYELEVRGPGAGKFEHRTGETPDILHVTSHSFDTVYMVFTPVFAACPDNVQPYVHYILADTTPEIKGTITGPDTVCSDNIYEYEFHLAPEMGDLDVTCTWEISSDAWEVLENPDPMRVVLHFLQGSRTSDTLFCYPRGMCGTGLPVKYPIVLREADPFDDEVVADTRPCLGTEIEVHLRDSALYNPYPDSIKFVWNTPGKWRRLSWDGQALATDSLPATRYMVQLDTAEAVIEVRMWRKGACGLSQTLRSAPVQVRDSAAKATVSELRILSPCYTRDSYNIVLDPKDDVDSAVWTLPAGLTYALSTRAAAAFKYDSLWIDNPDQRLTPISLPVRTVNECGHRDTVFVVRPITGIEPFSDALHVPRLCAGDTAHAWIRPPQSQTEQGAWYVWNLSDTAHTFLRQWNDSVVAMQFLVSPAGDSVHIRVTAVNDCAADSGRHADIAPHTFRLWPVSDPRTAVYGQSGVRLLIDSVAPGTKGDYTYVWTPSDRVVDSVPATRTLVQEEETFYVRARQVAEAGSGQMPFYRRDRLCVADDSVKIAVDSVFRFVPLESGAVCVDIADSLFAVSFGGNRQNYHLQWYEKVDSTWELISSVQDSALFAPVFDVPGTYFYRVVGFDSTFLRDEETDALILATSHRDTLEIEVHVYDLQAYFRNIASEEVEVPMGGRVEFLTRVEEGSGHYRFEWKPEGWVAAVDSTDGSMSTVALFREGEMTLTVTDSVSGCVRETTVLVKPGKGNSIPNVITPNGDGYNDIFLKGVSRLTIFTSWGEKIFHTEDGIGWDGSRNGQPVRPGEYLYVAEIDGADGTVRTVKGVVTVK